MYESTRGNFEVQNSMRTISLGMVPTGGLFVPSSIPAINWRDFLGKSYPDLAYAIMRLFLQDFSEKVLKKASSVYKEGIFDSSNPAPLVQVGDFGVLELWHGPTSAFKDMALQVLPYLLGESIRSSNQGSEVLILVATSGDTGKAALEGFKNVPGTQIVVFYPDGGVSAVQERQMMTTDGQNTYVVAVKGNFDQCQSAVKEIFASNEMREEFARKQITFSSANSINWGRLLPQIVYYVWAYLQAVEGRKIKAGAPVNVVVPTGNFGNLLAAYYAQKMGIPIGRLICASNKNNVLADFFATGVYDSRRPFYLTTSPSMDILISSNFERFLYDMSGRDPQKLRLWYSDLKQTGRFEVDQGTLDNARAFVYAGWADEEEVFQTINKTFLESGYVLDPHTAVAVKVYEDYVNETGDDTYTVVASTASPFKFALTVLQAISGIPDQWGEWEALQVLSEKTNWEVPEGLSDLLFKPLQNVRRCTPEEMKDLLREMF